MPANVGEMFYYGKVPWHGLGWEVAEPLTVEQALKAGGLDWEVGEVDLQTDESPASPVFTRKALVRLDRSPGHEGRVVGVTHGGFRPLQNRAGALLFDQIFGQGKPVYHTGGYLGVGEVVWLMAKIDKPINIRRNGRDDLIEPYALYSNSHDGSRPFSISLTTIRVVCQNTLNLALGERGLGKQFRRSHSGTLAEHRKSAQEFWSWAMTELNEVQQSFETLATRSCTDRQYAEILDELLPLPKKPPSAELSRKALSSYERRLADVKAAREKITALRQSGRGMDLPTCQGTFWGVLNAVTDYVDHNARCRADRLAYALLGSGSDLKAKAYHVVTKVAATAA